MADKMKAVIYGAGNIGRGFIGALLSQAGYEVIFIDIGKQLVDALNREKSYPLRILSNEGHEDTEIRGICAINGKDGAATSEAIAGSDLMATAVGANLLSAIAPKIAEGLRLRFRRSEAPLNILIAENLMDAGQILHDLVGKCLSEGERRIMDKRVGFVETSIGRMVPTQTEELRAGNPLRICVESYDLLPVDRDAFKGNLPLIDKMLPYSPFKYYLKRKMYIHNMGHCICAYMGMYTGKQYIWEAIANPGIELVVRKAMEESMRALIAEYAIPAREIVAHIDDLLLRFGNRALADTCLRVGKDPGRKLGAEDRLIGAAKNCLAQGISPVNICTGTAAALYCYIKENEITQSRETALGVLRDISELPENHALTGSILDMYDHLIM